MTDTHDQPAQGGAAAFALVFSALCLVLARVAAAGWRLIAFDERGVAQIDQLGRVRSVPWARVDRVVTAQQLLRGWLWREILRVWWWTSPGPLHLGFVVSATMIVVETRDWVCACWATREDLAALQERGFLWVG